MQRYEKIYKKHYFVQLNLSFYSHLTSRLYYHHLKALKNNDFSTAFKLASLNLSSTKKKEKEKSVHSMFFQHCNIIFQTLQLARQKLIEKPLRKLIQNIFYTALQSP